MGFRKSINSLNLNANTLKGRNTAFINFTNVSGIPKKDQSIDSHALPQLTSPTMAVANICVDVNNSPTYTHSPGLSSQTLGHSSLSP